MTRQHFNKLAWQLAQVEPDGPEDAKMVWESCITAVAQACKSSNAGFKPDLFKEACRYEYWKTHKIPD